MAKRTNQQALNQQRKQTLRDSEKFYAWLGRILSTGMAQKDFDKAVLLHKQGVTVEQMRSTLEKPHKR